MRLANIADLDAFFEMIDSCRGKVELISEEGDRLNLKSKLNQYVSLVKISSDGGSGKLEIIAEESADAEKIMNFMMNRE